MSKRENKIFSCPVSKLSEHVEELNMLFADGWLAEDTMVTHDQYVVLLKKEHEGKKVFYVDVTGLAQDKINEYMLRVKELVSNPDPDSDFFIPCR